MPAAHYNQAHYGQAQVRIDQTIPEIQEIKTVKYFTLSWHVQEILLNMKLA